MAKSKATPKAIPKAISEDRVRKSLVDQLKARGACLAQYESLVDDYMFYWRTKQVMEKDIEENGVTYTAVSASGNEYTKDNPSVKMIPQYTKTMLSILKELGLTTDRIVEEEEEL